MADARAKVIMLAHEFGIMTTMPQAGEKFVNYEPQKYECITVHDDHILPLLRHFKKIDFYWHSIDRPEKGLAYYGITLIPPASMEAVLSVIRGKRGLRELEHLLIRARDERKFIIHFGV